MHLSDADCPRMGDRDPEVIRSYQAEVGLLMYLTTSEQQSLMTQVYQYLLHHGGTFIFDLVPHGEQPPSGFIGRSLGWLMKRFTGGQSFIEDHRMRDQVLQDLQQVGFDSIRCLDAQNVAVQRGLPFSTKRTQQLIFVAECTPQNLDS